MAKVSIVIPTYNAEPFLRECLDSVVNQTLKDIEIICVNDGSTDSSLAIIREYASKDTRFKVIDKPNSGYGDSMNKGFDAATGEYLGIVEPDDYVALDMYETLYNKAKEYDLDLIKSDFHRFTGEGKSLNKAYNRLDRSRSYYGRVVDLQRDLKPFYFIMNTWSGIYKRAFIEAHQIRHNTTPGASFQDNGFWFQTFAWAKRAYFLDKPFYMNRRDNPNSSVKSKAKVYAMKHEYDYIYAFLDRNPELKERLAGMHCVKRFHNYSFTFGRIDHSFKKEFAKVFSADFREARRKGELDESLFTPRELEDLHLIIKSPVKYYRKKLNRLSLWEKIFSVKNDETSKVLRILGLKVKLPLHARKK